MQLSVIIVNWNSKDYLRECLRSLLAHSRSVPMEIIVVDGGSFDGCDKMLASDFPSVTFIQSQENGGFARSNNLGAARARGEFLLLLNPDTQFNEDSIRVLIDQIESLPRAGLAGCQLLNADRSLQTSSVLAFPTVLNQVIDSEFLRLRFPNWGVWGIAALFATPPRTATVEAVSGACMLVKREAFNAVGGFTEKYFMYGEDVDLCYKIKSAGYDIYYVPDTQIVHFGGGSSKKTTSTFSTVMMHHSIWQFIQLNRGGVSAMSYRGAMALTALSRLAIMAPLFLFGNRVVRHGVGSWKKWSSILSWSIGVKKAVVPSMVAGDFAVLSATKQT